MNQQPSTSKDLLLSRNEVLYSISSAWITVVYYHSLENPIRNLYKSHFVLFILLSLTSFVSCRGLCFKTQPGVSIEGGNYQRIKNFTLIGCQRDCIDDTSCFGFEFDRKENTCYLKSKSTSGTFVPKEDTVVGICWDPEDEFRDKLQNHVILGTAKAVFDGVTDTANACETLCYQASLPFFSWTPNDVQNDQSSDRDSQENSEEMSEDGEIEEYVDPRYGNCTCIEQIEGIGLVFDAFSGFLPANRKYKRSLWKSRHGYI